MPYSLLISIFILLVIVASSLTYYENSTEPQGLQGIDTDCGTLNYSDNNKLNSGGLEVSYLYSDDVSYLGNTAQLMLWICSGNTIFNLSNCNSPPPLVGYQISYTALYISNESYEPLFSHIVISVTNFSIAFNKTMIYNVSTNKGDVFGNNIMLWDKGDFSGDGSEYHYYLGEPDFCGPSLTKLIIPGNYTLYENITFTITVSLGILHFTSREYSIHKTWWELWGYNDLKY